jgi:hypothetical protein
MYYQRHLSRCFKKQTIAFILFCALCGSPVMGVEHSDQRDGSENEKLPLRTSTGYSLRNDYFSYSESSESAGEKEYARVIDELRKMSNTLAAAINAQDVQELLYSFLQKYEKLEEFIKGFFDKSVVTSANTAIETYKAAAAWMNWRSGRKKRVESAFDVLTTFWEKNQIKKSFIEWSSNKANIDNEINQIKNKFSKGSNFADLQKILQDAFDSINNFQKNLETGLNGVSYNTESSLIVDFQDEKREQLCEWGLGRITEEINRIRVLLEGSTEAALEKQQETLGHLEQQLNALAQQLNALDSRWPANSYKRTSMIRIINVQKELIVRTQKDLQKKIEVIDAEIKKQDPQMQNNDAGLPTWEDLGTQKVSSKSGYSKGGRTKVNTVGAVAAFFEESDEESDQELRENSRPSFGTPVIKPVKFTAATKVSATGSTTVGSTGSTKNSTTVGSLGSLGSKVTPFSFKGQVQAGNYGNYGNSLLDIFQHSNIVSFLSSNNNDDGKMLSVRVAPLNGTVQNEDPLNAQENTTHLIPGKNATISTQSNAQNSINGQDAGLQELINVIIKSTRFDGGTPYFAFKKEEVKKMEVKKMLEIFKEFNASSVNAIGGASSLVPTDQLNQQSQIVAMNTFLEVFQKFAQGNDDNAVLVITNEQFTKPIIDLLSFFLFDESGNNPTQDKINQMLEQLGRFNAQHFYDLGTEAGFGTFGQGSQKQLRGKQTNPLAITDDPSIPQSLISQQETAINALSQVERIEGQIKKINSLSAGSPVDNLNQAPAALRTKQETLDALEQEITALSEKYAELKDTPTGKGLKTGIEALNTQIVDAKNILNIKMGENKKKIKEIKETEKNTDFSNLVTHSSAQPTTVIAATPTNTSSSSSFSSTTAGANTASSPTRASVYLPQSVTSDVTRPVSRPVSTRPVSQLALPKSTTPPALRQSKQAFMLRQKTLNAAIKRERWVWWNRMISAKTEQQRTELVYQFMAPKTVGERAALLDRLINAKSPKQRKALIQQLLPNSTPKERTELANRLTKAKSPEQRTELVRQLRVPITVKQRTELLDRLINANSPKQRKALVQQLVAANIVKKDSPLVQQLISVNKKQRTALVRQLMAPKIKKEQSAWLNRNIARLIVESYPSLKTSFEQLESAPEKMPEFLKAIEKTLQGIRTQKQAPEDLASPKAIHRAKKNMVARGQNPYFKGVIARKPDLNNLWTESVAPFQTLMNHEQEIAKGLSDHLVYHGTITPTDKPSLEADIQTHLWQENPFAEVMGALENLHHASGTNKPVPEQSTWHASPLGTYLSGFEQELAPLTKADFSQEQDAQKTQPAINNQRLERLLAGALKKQAGAERAVIDQVIDQYAGSGRKKNPDQSAFSVGLKSLVQGEEGFRRSRMPKNDTAPAA